MRSQGGSLGTEAVNPIATCNVSVHAVANKSAVSFSSQCHMLNVSVSEVVFLTPSINCIFPSHCRDEIIKWDFHFVSSSNRAPVSLA